MDMALCSDSWSVSLNTLCISLISSPVALVVSKELSNEVPSRFKFALLLSARGVPVALGTLLVALEPGTSFLEPSALSWPIDNVSAHLSVSDRDAKASCSNLFDKADEPSILRLFASSAISPGKAGGGESNFNVGTSMRCLLVATGEKDSGPRALGSGGAGRKAWLCFAMGDEP